MSTEIKEIVELASINLHEQTIDVMDLLENQAKTTEKLDLRVSEKKKEEYSLFKNKIQSVPII